MSRTPERDAALTPLQAFLQMEAAGGLALMAAAMIAMLVANSPLAGLYAALLAAPITVGFPPFALSKAAFLWINDGLMVVFFFLVGLELKREALEGHLATPAQVALPAIAAVGGMAGPATLYWWFNRGDAVALQGWAIPTATDIAFALGVLSLLGSRVPPALKAFLLSIAIFDDIGAIVIIALFYTAEISGTALTIAAALIAVLLAMNRLGVLRPAAYIAVGIPLWVALLKSGVHATLAGVVLAMFIPLRLPRSDPEAAPLRRLEHALHPWVAFGVLPIFAFANAGVAIDAVAVGDLANPVFLGIVAGLVLGKLAGVLATSWLAIRLGVASLPEGANWLQLVGVALLCGVGFTMSLFIASLAFELGAEQYFGLERLGILAGSLIAGVAGYLVLRAALARQRT